MIGSSTRPQRGRNRRLRIALAIALLGATSLHSGSARLAAAQDAPPRYAITFEARIVPSQRVAEVRWIVGNGAAAVRELTLQIDPSRHVAFRGSGEVEVENSIVRWRPPVRGGSLSYRFVIDDVRGDDRTGYAARCSDSWALFRGDDLFPPARTRTLVGAESDTRLRLLVPEGWSVAVPFERIDGRTHRVDDSSRRFDRPTGWMMVGELGIRRERIAGSRIAIAGPVGHGVRRLDMLALLRWTLPRYRDVLGELPDRLLIVSAGDPMWRGGLSGRRSAYIHADRPLIAADATSPLLHELFHTLTRARSGEDGDWIVEGLAEYYSLEALVRSKTISRSRYRRALAKLERRGGSARLAGEGSSGPATARAVSVLRDLDRTIRERTDDQHSLDEVVAVLAERRERVTTADFQTIAEEVTGLALADFFRDRVTRELASAAR